MFVVPAVALVSVTSVDVAASFSCTFTPLADAAASDGSNVMVRSFCAFAANVAVMVLSWSLNAVKVND